MKRAPRLGVINAFEQGWLNILLSSHMDGFGTADACLYLSRQHNQSGRKYQRIPHAGRMAAILKKSPDFRKEDTGRAGIRWWRIGGEEE